MHARNYTKSDERKQTGAKKLIGKVAQVEASVTQLTKGFFEGY
jgi:hypothetical protein